VLETFTVNTFRPLVDDEFLLRPGDGTSISLRLVAATEAQGAPAGATRVPFSILFHGPVQPLLGQGTYSLGHATLGEFDMFLVPVAADSANTTYQAVFG
jgi:hypothetical protein